MGVTNKGALYYESGQQFHAFEEMTDSGDLTTFEASFYPFSGRSGFEPTVCPYGLETGGIITAAAANNQVDVSAATAVMPGATGAGSDGVVTVAADAGLAVTRPTTGVKICSVIIDDTGAYAVVAGTDGGSFVETRGADGGPPLIPVGACEVGQVRLSGTAAAVVLSTEIYQVVGTHREESGFPVYSQTDGTGEVTFAAALPAIHTGSLPKKVYVKGYTPIFAGISNASDFVPAETSHSVNSVDTYDGPIGSVSSSIGQGSFTARLKDGITDHIVGLKNETLWFKWFQDRDRSPYILTQGVLGLARTFSVGDHVVGSFTLSASKTSTEHAS